MWVWWVSGSTRLQGTRLPGGSCAASYFIMSHTAEYPMCGGSRWSIWVSRARSDQDSIRRLEVMLSQAVCAAYIHMYKDISLCGSGYRICFLN
eukprot:1146117-Pelagomonas_calceolata.AAC.2